VTRTSATATWHDPPRDRHRRGAHVQAVRAARAPSGRRASFPGPASSSVTRTCANACVLHYTTPSRGRLLGHHFDWALKKMSLDSHAMSKPPVRLLWLQWHFFKTRVTLYQKSHVVVFQVATTDGLDQINWFMNQ
jgi:hypothetical protein